MNNSGYYCTYSVYIYIYNFSTSTRCTSLHSDHAWHAILFETLAARKREAALPGEVGGFRTFRDVRVVGRSTCDDRSWWQSGRVGALWDSLTMFDMVFPVSEDWWLSFGSLRSFGISSLCWFAKNLGQRHGLGVLHAMRGRKPGILGWSVPGRWGTQRKPMWFLSGFHPVLFFPFNSLQDQTCTHWRTWMLAQPFQKIFRPGRIRVKISGASIRFFCRLAARVEGGAAEGGPAGAEQLQVATACRQALSVDKGSFTFLGLKRGGGSCHLMPVEWLQSTLSSGNKFEWNYSIPPYLEVSREALSHSQESLITCQGSLGFPRRWTLQLPCWPMTQSPLWVPCRCPPSAWLKQSWRHTLGIWLWSWRRGRSESVMARLFFSPPPSMGQMQGRSRDMILPRPVWWHWQLRRSFLMARYLVAWALAQEACSSPETVTLDALLDDVEADGIMRPWKCPLSSKSKSTSSIRFQVPSHIHHILLSVCFPSGADDRGGAFGLPLRAAGAPGRLFPCALSTAAGAGHLRMRRKQRLWGAAAEAACEDSQDGGDWCALWLWAFQGEDAW